MARQRERFERTDVPRGGRHTNLIGAIVCVAVLALAAGAVAFAWNRASLESRMGDTALGDALSALGRYGVEAPAEGYVETGDAVSCTLLLTADSLDAQGATLTGARILAVNETQGTAVLVSLPTDLALTVDDQQTTLAELFSSEGYAACVTPLGRAAGVRFDHAILATGDVLEQAAQLAGSSAADLVRSASGFLSQIRTDMDAAALLSFAEGLASIGTANLTTSDAPLAAETTTDEAGNVTETGRQVLDATQLGVALGRLAPAA